MERLLQVFSAWHYFSVLDAGTQEIVFEQEHVYSSEK